MNSKIITTCAAYLRVARSSIFVGALMAALAVSAVAQSAAPAKLSGVVRDPTGALVPGAVVKLVGAGGKTLVTVLTDASGRFVLVQPVMGSYDVVVVREGFSSLDVPLRVTGVTVAPMTLTMQLANVSDTVTVNADTVDAGAPEANKDAATLSAGDFKNLPVFDNDVVGTLTPFLDAGVVGEGGTTLMVDGVETSSLQIAASAIQSVTTNEDPYSAEYRQPGRGQVSIITKVAEEKFHGEASFTYRNSALNGTNYFATVKPPESRRLYEGYLTGPVRPFKDTAFLFSMSRKERDVATQVLATTLPAVTPEINVPTPTRTTQITMKVSRQYNEHHSAYVLYTFEDDSGVNQNVGGLVQASAGYSDNEFDQHLTYHDDMTLSATLLNQLTLHYERDYQSTISNNKVSQIVVNGVATFGGAQLDGVYTENNPTITDQVSWSVTKRLPQQIKFGVQLPNLGRRVWEDGTNRQGTYVFANAAAYASGSASTFSVQQGQSKFITLYAQPSAFFLDQMQVTPKLTVTAGVRYDFQNTIANTKDGFLPRLSLAYVVDKAHELVVRVGGGLYIRRVGVNIGQQLARYQFATERNLLLTSNICYPTCTAAQLAAEPPSLFEYQPGLQSPEQGYFGLSVERQLTKNSTVSLGYNGYRGWHTLRSVDINAPLPPFISPARPNANFAQVLQLQSEGYQKTDGMTLSYRGRVKNVVSGFLQYTLQHADSDTEFSTFTPQNQYDPNNEWSRSAFDQRQRFGMFATIYPDKPVTLGVGFFNDTPLPYTETTGTDFYQTGLFNARPAGVARNSLNGGSFQDLQLRIGYTKKLRPAVKDDVRTLAFSVSSFNTINRVNFTAYDGVVGSPNFRQAVSAADPRRLQVQVGYSF